MFNISAINNNNTFVIQWPKGAGLVNYTVVIPDGFYSYNDLNNYIIYYCKLNGLYILDSIGTVINFISISSNPTYYAV